MSKMTKNKLALLALAGLGAVASGPTLASGMTVDSKGGLEVFELDENNYWFKISGRIFADQVFFDTDDDDFNSSFPSGAVISSARVTFKGGVGGNWVYKFDVDLVDSAGNPGRSRFGEAFVGYSGCKNFWIALGQVSIPFGLENWASSSDLPFMELSMPTSAFAPDKGIGLYAEWHGHMFTAAAALYHPAAGFRATGDVLSVPALSPFPASPVAGTGPIDSAPGSDDTGASARVTFSPVHDDRVVYHAGVSARYENLHEHANNFNFIGGFELQSRQTPSLFTNIPPNSSKAFHVWGFELAGRWGPFLLEGEYMIADVDRDAGFAVGDLRNPGGDLDYHGYYVEASYVLTGEAREYDFDSGTFGPVHPRSRKGAWEIGVRHSFIDLLDNPDLANSMYFPFVDFVPTGSVTLVNNTFFPATGGNNFATGINSNNVVGSINSTTIGLTWWVNDNVRFMANYVRTHLPFSSDFDALGFRAQVTW